jgi:PAS domain S-box-containing protein
VTQELRRRESHRELSLIIDNVPCFVWCASTDGQLTYINKRLSEYVGASVDSLLDTGWLDGVHPDDRAVALDTWMRCVSTGTPLENQYRLRRADGVYRWFHVPRQLVHTSDGQPTLWYGLLVDIEERKVQNKPSANRKVSFGNCWTSCLSLLWYSGLVMTVSMPTEPRSSIVALALMSGERPRRFILMIRSS